MSSTCAVRTRRYGKLLLLRKEEARARIEEMRAWKTRAAVVSVGGVNLISPRSLARSRSARPRLG